MHYEVMYSPGDPNKKGWMQKDQDINTRHQNWYRLSRIVFTDLFYETGVYYNLKRGQRAKLDRKNQLAINPQLPLTRGERSANRGHTSGFPLWSIPLLLGASFVGAGVDAAERYSKTERLGSHYLANRFHNLHQRLAIDETVRGNNGVNEGIVSRLAPQLRVGSAAVLASQEPANYIVNMADLLEATEEALRQDGTTANLERRRRHDTLFTEKAPQPLSAQDQRVRAAEVFMSSSLLSNGEICDISLERRADYHPDGEKTFRIEMTTPYAYLYEGIDMTGAYEPYRRLYADRLLNPDPIAELVQSSIA